MARSVPAAILTALAQSVVRPFYAVEMSFDSGSVRLWTGYGDRTIDGQSYFGTGRLMSISGLEEVNNLSAKQATISLDGISSSIVSLALSEPYQRRACRILWGVTDVDDFVEVFGGYMNTMQIEDSGETSNITLTVESKLVELNRPRSRRYTHESQKSRFPTDTFFSFVADLQDKQIPWGRKTTT
jgi:hypothetical protein